MSYILQNPAKVLELTQQHLLLTIVSLALAVVIALPLGLLLARHRRLYPPVMALLSLIYTIPSVALLVLLIPVMGLGFWPTVVALVAYCQAILVRNIVAGLTQVDRGVLESARGMGLNPLQILRQVEIPLALPVMLAGLRVAAISTIAIATVAAFFNAGGLGALIREGISQDFGEKIFAGVIAVSLVAVVAEQGLSALARGASRYRRA